MEAEHQRDQAHHAPQLEDTGVAELPPVPDYEKIVHLAAQICDVPMAFVRVDGEPRGFAGAVGLDVPEAAATWDAFREAILNSPPFGPAGTRALIVQDASADGRFADHPLVMGPPKIRFCAGFALESDEADDGDTAAGDLCVHGILCVMDSKPRCPSGNQLHLLAAMAKHAATAIETRCAVVRRRNSEEARRETESRFGLMAHQSPALIWVTDERGRIEYVNQRALEFLHGSIRAPRDGRAKNARPDLQGALLLDWIHPEDRESVEGLVGGLSPREPVEIEARIVDAEDSCRWMRLSVVPRWNGSGQFAGLIGTGVDLTAQKLAEERLRQAARVKTELLSALSHGIRTPMHALIGTTGLLQDTGLTPDQRDYVSTIRKGADSLLTVVDGLLDFAWNELGKQNAQPEGFSTDLFLEETTTALSEQARRKGLGFCCFTSPEVPSRVFADLSRLRQIVTGAIANSIEHTDSGEVTVRLRMSSVSESATPESGHTRVRFEVQDTRVRFPEQVHPVGGSERRAPWHCGSAELGIAVCSRLVEGMGGSSGTGNHTDRGFIFWAEIPVGELAGPVNAHDLADPAESVDLAKLRVLVVDSVESDRHAAGRLLESWRGTPDYARDGSQAITCIRRAAQSGDPYRICILGCGMPGIGAIDVARVLSADSTIPPVSLIMAAAWKDRAELELAWNAGFRSLLTKPLRRHSLARSVQKALTVGLSGAECARQAPRPDTDSKLLLVEDDESSRKLAVRLLEKHGFACDTAANGLEAVEKLRMTAYPLVLMDCHMPVMDGFRATAAIRRREQSSSTARTPIIALTAHALPEDRASCLAAGMDDYLSKPVGESRLVAAIEKWLPPGGNGARQDVTGVVNLSVS